MGSSGRGRHRSGANGLAFAARWGLAVAAALLVAGVAEYGLARQSVIDRGLEESTRNYEALAAGLAEALTEGAGLDNRAAIGAEIRHLSHSYGTVYVALLGADGHLIARSERDGDASEKVHPSLLAEVVATGQTIVRPEAQEGEVGTGRYEYLVPVTGPDGTLVLHIDQHADIITDMVGDLGRSELIGLSATIMLALPLSYLFGGRSLQRRQLHAQQQADADPLTGLSGRRPFNPSLEAALADRSSTGVSLALIDLDGFKQLNDRLGHSHGDRVLQAVADSFGELGPTDTPFRLGGDEFAVILPGKDENQVVDVLESVRAALAKRFPGVSFSAGVASSTGEPLALTELWERSDAALYEAKRLGRHRSISFSSMAHGHAVSAEKIDELTALVAGRGTLTVAFQPIWDLRRGVVLAHEALLRLPKGSRISGPQEAFELAERLGVAPALDRLARSAVLAAVTSQAWEGLLFLNIHPNTLPEFDLDDLTAELALVELEPQDVVLEVTEQAGLNHPEPLRTLKQAQARGFRVALDDMGRSNAGLHALRLVNFDIIKIDGEVIAGLDKDPSSLATVQAAITFIEQTGGWIVAEGIEEPGMLTTLLRLRPGLSPAPRRPVIAGQGYLLGRPSERPIGLNSHLPLLDQHFRDPLRAQDDLDDLDEAFYGKD